MKNARDVAHAIVGAECLEHEEFGWSHGWRCEAIRDAVAARDAEYAKVREALTRELDEMRAKCSALEAENLCLYREPTRAKLGRAVELLSFWDFSRRSDSGNAEKTEAFLAEVAKP